MNLTGLTVGMGCMRLSTETDRDDDRAVALISAAIEAGVTFFDTANVYCHDETELGHNERLIARALSGCTADKSSIIVATKGGLARPGGRWVADGRAKSLRAACYGSLAALGVDCIDLYQLHAVDPKTPLRTSVRALASLQHDGLIRNVGLCNVTVPQIRTAQSILRVASVQIELNPLVDENFRNGVAEYCRDHDIPIIAARPLAGKRVGVLRKHTCLVEIGNRHNATPEEIALAWLRDLHPELTPIPGTTSPHTLRSLQTIQTISLTEHDRIDLDESFPAGRLLRTTRAARRPSKRGDGEVLVIMGSPASGKTSIATEFVAAGYHRLNRDELGGSLKGLIPILDDGLASGKTKWVLDNTYPTRATRNHVIETAWRYSIPVRCIWLQARTEDMQVNAIARMIRRHGKLPRPEELSVLGKTDPTMFAPGALFRYERMLEPPTTDEGFESIETRHAHQIRIGGDKRGIFLDVDAILDPASLSTIRSKLRALKVDGWTLLGFAWRPQMEIDKLHPDILDREFRDMQESLGEEFEISYCPHRAGPPKCWCRIPFPGLIIALCQKYSIDPTRSVLVGNSSADNALARKLHIEYQDASSWISTNYDERSL